MTDIDAKALLEMFKRFFENREAIEKHIEEWIKEVESLEKWEEKAK